MASLETNVHGLFAVGDIRSGSIKRVAASVGEGAQVVSALHLHFAEEDRLTTSSSQNCFRLAEPHPVQAPCGLTDDDGKADRWRKRRERPPIDVFGQDRACRRRAPSRCNARRSVCRHPPQQTALRVARSNLRRYCAGSPSIGQKAPSARSLIGTALAL